MAKTELPYSVSFSRQDFGPGTLSRVVDGHKVSEANGIVLKKDSQATDRVLSLKSKDGQLFGIVFKPSDDLDTIAVYPEDQGRRHVARNGEYIEIGADGITAQYDLTDGSLRQQEISIDAPSYSLPLSLSDENRELVTHACSELRNHRTPFPDMLVRVATMLDQALTRPVNFEQIPLFS